MIEQNLKEICGHFCLDGEAVSAAAFGNGHINDTYRVCCEGTAAEYILQRMNCQIFHHPEEVMENVDRVTAWLRERIQEEGGDPGREVLTIVPGQNGSLGLWLHGNYWRMYRFIQDATAYDQAPDEAIFRESAVAFGHFQYLLRDFPSALLHETIPDFHNTPKRFEAFAHAVRSDGCGRCAGARQEIDFLMERADLAGVLRKLQDAGSLPLRVTHNDTKLNNVMIDNKTRRGICVIDLDTVMPGLSVTDFGDSIRFGASTGKEDEPDLEKVNFDLEKFRVYTEGFLAGTAGALTQTETEMLPWGAMVITFEQAIRFLGDYLEGDPYYKTEYPEHNLVRARTQIRLLDQMQKKADAMHKAVQDSLRS